VLRQLPASPAVSQTLSGGTTHTANWTYLPRDSKSWLIHQCCWISKPQPIAVKITITGIYSDLCLSNTAVCLTAFSEASYVAYCNYPYCLLCVSLVWHDGTHQPIFLLLLYVTRMVIVTFLIIASY